MELETKLGGLTQMKSQFTGNSEEKIDSKYRLRENRRKTWRGEDFETPNLITEQNQRICKQCGKGFKSMKALCGHMACHSTKDRFFMGDETVSETDVGGAQKRPKRVASERNRKAKFCSVFENDSSSVSGIDFEQEEVAMCLIMLSRDSRNWVGVGSNQESTDSVVLETKSSSIDMKIGRKRDGECVYEGVEIKKFVKGKWKSEVFYSENEESTESGLGNGSDSKIMKFGSKTKKKKTKAHECPYCNRVFKSGQAMGGHKRTHFLGNSGNRNTPITTVLEAETSEAKHVIDLNLPAPEEDEESENSQFGNW